MAVAATELGLDALMDHATRLVADTFQAGHCDVIVGREVPAVGQVQVPLVVEGAVVGLLVLSGADGPVRLTAEEWTELDGVAAVLALALGGTASARAEWQGLDDIVDELNRAMPLVGTRVLSIALAQSRLRTVLGGRSPVRDEAEAIQAWRHEIGRCRRLSLKCGDGQMLVPVASRGSVLGALRVVAGPGSSHDEHVLLALGEQAAALVKRAGLSRLAEENDRRVAVALERDRIAQDLHDSVGQLITGIGLRLVVHMGDAPDDLWREQLGELLALTDRTSRELRRSIEGLLSDERDCRDLEAAIGDLCRDFEAITGIAVELRVSGSPMRVGTAKEEALFRVVHEALVNVDRHADASTVVVELEYGDDALGVSVRDDGKGLNGCDPFGKAGHFGVRTMQRRVEDVGGELRVSRVAPHGVLVEAVIPGRKGTAHAAGTGGADR